MVTFDSLAGFLCTIMMATMATKPAASFVTSPVAGPPRTTRKVIRQSGHERQRSSYSSPAQNGPLQLVPVDSLLDMATPFTATSSLDASMLPHQSSLFLSETIVDMDTTPQRLSDSAIIAIFLVGILPFGIATVEFWRRIAVGESFGTGADSVVIIGEDNAPQSSRGRRVLGKGALALAYVLFAIATGVLLLVVVSVLTTTPAPPMPETLLPSVAEATTTAKNAAGDLVGILPEDL
mmetsp:Transcript_17864/g.36947  ORF Transcript_17864/g.36947 Transcript_17864/m.36947 type:complete len:236 (-) Transcript_17864:1004-1711(-)|eukprot:CAMPEP_0172451816 /NCGR_PEP_ID=MMETSP1065-20121228/9690_1 /TAXON_ID=265537 /ORGANISM="Amphiprora paludosa, Strain CCMP125" /LENGTH=235 /DNA_ID=CAMNT_0013203787 /DNA_START=98 /DNA_END=805 /DNA_ORIENTATION=-